MTSEIKVDTISEQTSANGVTIDGLTIKDGNIIGDVALAGTTPTFTVGDGGAEDAALIFDGNAVDYYMALDDSADNLIIGSGSTVGSNSLITIDSDGDFTLDSTGDIILDVGGGDIKLTNAGSNVGEINLNTNGGDIQLANKTSDKDITFHVSDSGSIITALQIDGSDAGTAIFNHDISLSTDGAIIKFGANSEVLLTHVHDRGLSISHDGGGDPDLILNNTASASDGNQLGQIFWNGLNSNGDEHTYAFILGQVRDVTDGEEDGQLLIYANKGGTSKQFLTIGANSNAASPDHEVCINEESQNIDFRVESNGNTHMLFVDGGNDHVNIGTSSDLGATFNVKAPDNNTTQQLVLTDNDNQTKTHIGNFSNTTYITNNTHYNGSSWVKDDNAVGTSFIGAGDGSVNFGTSTDATPTVRMTIDSTGAVTMPTQPAFCANPSTTQSNISNNVTLVFGTERFDQNGDFASNTFTAPVTGRYQLQYSLRFEGVDTNADFFRVNMVTSNNTYELLLDPGAYGTTPNYQDFAMGVLADMDANDTAFLRFDYGGISDPSSFDLRVASFFSGYLVC